MAHFMCNDFRRVFARGAERPVGDVPAPVPGIHPRDSARPGGRRCGVGADAALAAGLRRSLVNLDVGCDVDVERHVILGNPLPHVPDLRVAYIRSAVGKAAPVVVVVAAAIIDVDHPRGPGQALQRDDAVVVGRHIIGHPRGIQRWNLLRHRRGRHEADHLVQAALHQFRPPVRAARLDPPRGFAGGKLHHPGKISLLAGQQLFLEEKPARFGRNKISGHGHEFPVRPLKPPDHAGGKDSPGQLEPDRRSRGGLHQAAKVGVIPGAPGSGLVRR